MDALPRTVEGTPRAPSAPHPQPSSGLAAAVHTLFPRTSDKLPDLHPKGWGESPNQATQREKKVQEVEFSRKRWGFFVNLLFPWFAEIILGRKREVKKGEGKGNMFFLFTPLSPGPTRGPLPPALDLTLPLSSDPNPGSGLKHATATNPFPKGPRGTPCHKHNPRGGTGCPSHNHSPLPDSPQHQPPHPNIQHSQALCHPPKQPPEQGVTLSPR